jgi:sulfur-oxidizing protein SoxZ
MMLGRVSVPPTIRKGEPFEIKVLVQHPMETGYRRDLNGQAIAMNIVDKLVCRIGGREVFSAELGSGMAANPYIEFYAVVDQPGTVEVEWSDDRGERGKVTAPLNVS